MSKVYIVIRYEFECEGCMYGSTVHGAFSSQEKAIEYIKNEYDNAYLTYDEDSYLYEPDDWTTVRIYIEEHEVQ